MSSASTIGLPYTFVTQLTLQTPQAGIVSDTNFVFEFLEDIPIISGTYIASLYIEIVEEGADTEIGTVTTHLANATTFNSFPLTSNYLGETGVIAMEGIPLKIQNTQLIIVEGPATMTLVGNIIFENTPPTATGFLLLKPV